MSEIRAADPTDAEEIARIYRPYVSDSVISFELDPPSAEVMAQRMADSGDVYPWLVADGPQGLLGYAYGDLHRSRPAYRFSVEVSVYIEESARVRGLGRRLMTALLDELSFRRFNVALAGTTLPNPASIALFTSLGFEEIGVFREVGFKFGAWHHVSWWQKRLGGEKHSRARPGPNGARSS